MHALLIHHLELIAVFNFYNKPFDSFTEMAFSLLLHMHLELFFLRMKGIIQERKPEENDSRETDKIQKSKSSCG